MNWAFQLQDLRFQPRLAKLQPSFLNQFAIVIRLVVWVTGFGGNKTYDGLLSHSRESILLCGTLSNQLNITLTSESTCWTISPAKGRSLQPTTSIAVDGTASDRPLPRSSSICRTYNRTLNMNVALYLMIQPWNSNKKQIKRNYFASRYRVSLERWVGVGSAFVEKIFDC